MNSYNRTYKWGPTTIMVLLIIFTYITMKSAVYNTEVGSISTVITLVFAIAGFLSLPLYGESLQTNFSGLWIGWCVWLIVDFFVLGLRGGGIASIINVSFCPLLFLFFFKLGKFYDNSSKIVFLGGIVVFIITVYMVLMAVVQVSPSIINNEEMPAFNLIYWVLCILPVMLLSEKKWFHYIILVITIFLVAITGKRGATLSIIWVLVVYLNDYKKKDTKNNRFMTILVVFIITFFVLSQVLELQFMTMFSRFQEISEDKGSGRTIIYGDILTYMGQSNLLEWLFGHGYGTITMTRHSAAHNDALQMLFEFGLVGLYVYISMLVYIIKRSRILKKIKSPYYLSYKTSVIIALVLGMVSDLVVFYSYFSFLCIYWGLMEGKMMNSNCLKKTRWRN